VAYVLGLLILPPSHLPNKKNMIKVVYNACYGGYGLSQKAMERLAQLGVSSASDELQEMARMMEKEVFLKQFESYRLGGLPRHDARLVQVVEELGEAASAGCANFRIHLVEGDRYRIDDYDGFERVCEPKDIDWITVES
jgi:hypothetical protein